MNSTASTSPDRPAPFHLADFFPYRLSILSNRVSNLIAQDYAEKFDLRVPDWRVIMVLYEPDQLTASEIAEATLMDRVRVTRTLQQLLTKEIVSRRASKTDGRSAYITLTAKGREIYDAVIPLALDYERQVLSVLSETEKVALTGMMEKLDGRLKELERPD